MKKLPKKKISVNWLIDQVEKEKGLSKEAKFEKVIDIAYRRIYGVKGESWENEINITELLVEVAENRAKNGVYSRFKETVNSYLL